MKIEITLNGNKYAVYAQSQSFDPVKYEVIKDEKSKNHGQETEKQLGYYSKLPSALLRCLREEVTASDDTITLREFMERYEALNNELHKQFEKIKL